MMDIKIGMKENKGDYQPILRKKDQLLTLNVLSIMNKIIINSQMKESWLVINDFQALGKENKVI